MDIYYIIHISLFLCLIFELCSLNVKKKVILFWMIFFTLFGGLRWRIGGDWDQYFHHFIASDWTNIFSYDRYGNGAEKLEPGFVFLNVFVKTLFGEFWIYNLLVVGFIQFTYYKFCNYFFPKNPLLVYALLMVLASNYFPVRAGLSVGISYWVWRFIYKQNLKMFLLVTTLATLIHNQCIILFPCYWLGRINLKSYWYLLIYPMIAGGSYILQNYFVILTGIMGGDIAEKAAFYTEFETEGFTGASYIGWALNYGFLIVYLYLRKRNLYCSIWYNALLNSVMIYNTIFMIFSNGMGDLARLSGLLYPAQCILFFYSLLYFMNKKKSIISRIAVAFFLAYYIYKLPACWSGYFFKDNSVPYKTIFDYNHLN